MENEEPLLRQQLLGMLGLAVKLVQCPSPHNREGDYQSEPAILPNEVKQSIVLLVADVSTRRGGENQNRANKISGSNVPLEQSHGIELDGVVEEDTAVEDEAGLVGHLDV